MIEETLLSDATISGQWFISFERKRTRGLNSNQFLVKRGYIDVRKKILPGVSGRITPDISVDKDGDGEGDLEMRLKYCYVGVEIPEISTFITNPKIEFGLVPRPWLEFEQKINRYRVQGHMYLERADLINSADFGMKVAFLLGGKMDNEYTRNIQSRFPGKYGSVSIGIMNGGGYHAIEKNENKTIETRLTIRPVPDILPGAQISYAGVMGKGNTAEAPDYSFHAGFLSVEETDFRITGTFYTGKGNYKGKGLTVDPTAGDARKHNGFSLFGEWIVPMIDCSVFGRFEKISIDTGASDISIDSRILGLAYHITRKSKVLFDYDLMKTTDLSDVTRMSLSVEYSF